MFQQVFVTVSIVVSSFFMDRFYVALFSGSGNYPTSQFMAAEVMSFATAVTLSWSSHFEVNTAMFNRGLGWRGRFRALIGMGFQNLAVLALVAFQSSKISSEFISYTTTIAILTTLLLYALILTPKRKSSSPTTSA